MYEEKGPKEKKIFLFVLGLITLAFVLLSFPHWIGWTSFLWIYETAVLGALTVALYLLIRYLACEYSYILIDDEVVIVGKKRNAGAVFLASCKTRDIVCFEPYVANRDYGVSFKGHSFGVADRKRAYVLVYKSENGNKGCLFQPSEKFVKLLKQIIS